ncbi:ATP-dependent nuclease [Carboxylicivirga marina]|uniref:AAA family ATPase n=1 Tax=Carboxylicivirga marina TaxID=2800988 RepID=A0ABS1HQL3_9BACT|nr:ATP-binding protein [Carboxylicivirga marina]MBK3519905.1 AAA family ATPase [Carboxylicivirga marina]
MNLVKFSVTNFRSITQAYRIPITEIAVLIGKNNEGKSNMLRALNIAMNILRFHADSSRRRYSLGYLSRNNESHYRWERDFPIPYQTRTKNTQSIFRLEFELNSSEVQEFKSKIGSNLNGTLPIEIRIGKDQEPKIKVIKTGRGAKTLNSKSKNIAEYIADRIFFNYIPAVRTDQEAIKVVNEMMSEELAKLESDEKYKEALDTIKDLQTPILNSLSENIKESLTEFIPHIKDVSIEIQEGRRRYALRQQLDIVIDDGNKTNLEFKGDGVKSLAALGLLKNISVKEGVVSLVAIEEPESHLHPGAIHILRDTIYELAGVNQVIVSTHNPLFVDRNNLRSNIIIDSGKAKAAKSIREIRDIIGVKASDNLLNANYVLVVEGEEDIISLRAILPTLSDKIAKALKSNLLVIDKIGGAGNLSYKLSLLKNSLCSTHVLLDNDAAGRNAFNKAKDDDSLKVRDCTFINCNGMTNSEFEDCLNKDAYLNEIQEEYGVNVVPQFRTNKKWSERMRAIFLSQGKPWTEQMEAQVKSTVAKAVAKKPETSLNTHKRNSIDALVVSLDKLIEKAK